MGAIVSPRTPYWARDASETLAALGSSERGLGADEAAARLVRLGRNEVRQSDHVPAVRLLLRQVASPLVLILVFGAVVSLLVQEWLDAGIILAIVIGSVFLGFLQEYRASAAVAALRQRLAITARVIRDGRERTVPASTVVPGDLVRLSAGNLVPGDGVLLAARDFMVTQASLTGESLPVEKQPGPVPATAPLAARANTVFLGTSVRSGTATALIVATGTDTEFGAIAGSLSRDTRETEFSRGVRQFGYLLVRVMLVMVVFVLLVNQLLGRPALESLLFAMALAVGMSPELLPAIVSVTLSRGAKAMAARGVIVPRLEAIEDLGSMDVLCTDKTGTLTVGSVALVDALDPSGRSDPRVLRQAYLNAAFETGIENPLDAALVAAGTRAGLDTTGCSKIDEIPYDFVRRRLTIVLATHERPLEHQVITKGACASVLDVCDSVANGGEILPLDAAARERIGSLYRQYGEEGHRVLGIAEKRVTDRPGHGRDDEAAMTFLGFLRFQDPIRETAAATIRSLAARGIRTKIITGDNRFVAAHVAEGVGLDPRALLAGSDLAAMADDALGQRAAVTDVFVEVDPQQKERIVRALQATGHAVGYLGDGINDVPALRAADVGISVDQAVDVARESADVVLLRPDLDVLRQGVEDGRRTFANTLKYIGITTSANFGNMVSMALATPFLPFLPLAAKQILLNNFLSDVPSVFISTDNVDPEHLATAQRWSVAEVRRFMLSFGLLSTVFDLVTFAVLLRVFGAEEADFQTGWFVVSLATELLVVLSLRTRGPAWRSRPGTPLAITTVAVLAVALALPWSGPVASLFGFRPVPAGLALTLAGVIAGYLAATEFLKARLYTAGRRC